MSRMERLNRTVNDPRRFNGGYVGHGTILPMEAPRKSLFKALRDAWRSA